MCRALAGSRLDQDDRDQDDPAAPGAARSVRHAIGLPTLARVGLPVLGYYATEPAENTFPALPVREGERVFVAFAAVPDEQIARAPALLEAFVDAVGAEAAVRRLQPTRRSLIHGGSLPCAATGEFVAPEPSH